MSRSIIAVIVAVVIAALTATAYLVTTSTQHDRIERTLRERVGRAAKQLHQDATIEGLSVLRKIETLAASPRLVEALQAVAGESPNWRRLATEADLAFSELIAAERGAKPDVLALLDRTGDVVHMHGVPVPTAGEFKADGTLRLPALGEALARRVVISELGRMPGVGLARIATAPVVDHEASAIASAEAGEERTVIAGAVIAAYAVTGKVVQAQDQAVGARVAYLDGGQVAVTSFRRGHEEHTEMRAGIARAAERILGAAGDARRPGDEPHELSIGGARYLAALVPLPRASTRDLPATYPRQDASALVLVAVGDEAAAVVRPARTMILLLGAGALAIALLGLYLLYRRFELQIDDLEAGVAEIINGNLDRTFEPVGEELDGLANGLNVMLARVLGRPEPGEEAFDDHGNPIVPGKVDFEEAEGPAPPQTDPELAALAREAEPDYYKRVFTEYVAARTQTGAPDDVSFESFIAKLRVNEAKLKAQYDCRQVRFRVVVKDGKVTLKPVPIF
jgi:hypothetical protein